MSRTAPPAVVRKKIQTTSGRRSKARCSTRARSICSSEPMTSRSICSAKTGDRYRAVTSQTDWPTYNGDPSGNRYTKLSQIDKSNVAQPRAALDFSDAERLADREHAGGGGRHHVRIQRQRMFRARRGQRPR